MALISFCSFTGKNTGGVDCDVQLQNPSFMFVGSAVFTPAEYASEAALKAAILDRINRSNGDTEKLYPFSQINAVNRTTEADTVETAANGQKRTLRTAPESYELTHWNVGINQEAGIIGFNGATIPVFIVTDSGQMVGRFDSDKNFLGHRAQINTKAAGYSNYTNGPATVTSVNFLDPLALSTNLRLFSFAAFDSAEYGGLLDVELHTIVAPTGNAHKIGVRFDNKDIAKGYKNMYDDYSTELADVDLWYGIAVSNGATLVPSTVVVDSALEGWTVTFAAPVSAIGLSDVDVLNTNNVIGIEGIELAI